jgi:hypothetical protein
MKIVGTRAVWPNVAKMTHIDGFFWRDLLQNPELPESTSGLSSKRDNFNVLIG